MRSSVVLLKASPLPRRVVVRKLKGFATLTLEGRATSVLMDRESKTRAFENMSRADVARAVAEEHGYEGTLVDVEDTGEVLEVINQTGETDARFLRRLASREEFEFYVDDGGFHFHERRQSAAPTHVFTWYADPGRDDVLSVNVESDLGRRAGRVTVRGRDPLTRSTIEETANNDSTDRETLAEVVEVVDPETGATTVETRNATATVAPTSAPTSERAGRERSRTCPWSEPSSTPRPRASRTSKRSGRMTSTSGSCRPRSSCRRASGPTT